MRGSPKKGAARGFGGRVNPTYCMLGTLLALALVSIAFTVNLVHTGSRADESGLDVDEREPQQTKRQPLKELQAVLSMIQQLENETSAQAREVLRLQQAIAGSELADDDQRQVAKLHEYVQAANQAMEKKLQQQQEAMAKLRLWARGAGASQAGQPDPDDPQPKVLTLDDIEMSPTDRSYVRKYGVHLQGLKCETLKGEVVCFVESSQGRELCPRDINPVSLTMAKREKVCEAAQWDNGFCMAACQEGSDEVKWNAYAKQTCAENWCPPRYERIPYKDYKIVPWTGKDLTTCKVVSSNPEQYAAVLKQISVTVLARDIQAEAGSLQAALKTWDPVLFPLVGEVLIMLNDYKGESSFLEPEVRKYKANHPHLRMLTSAPNTNLGIGAAFARLLREAKQKYVLFLEKDFQLIEEKNCVLEQLGKGVELISAGRATTVKYRSRVKPGHPNWAERNYGKGNEQKLLSREPGLACHMFHWLERGEVSHPKVFSLCNESPRFVCTAAQYCKWTNNPVLFSLEWFKKVYLDNPSMFGNNVQEGVWGLEGNIPWAGKPWIVAAGDGLFCHRDKNNFGVALR